jgi:hypothetical protein
MCPLCPISIHGSPVTSPKFQMAPSLMLLISSGSKKEEPRYTCLNEAKTSHSQRIWAEFSSCAPHLLHNGLSDSPISWECLLRVLCPVRRLIKIRLCVNYGNQCETGAMLVTAQLAFGKSQIYLAQVIANRSNVYGWNRNILGSNYL